MTKAKKIAAAVTFVFFSGNAASVSDVRLKPARYSLSDSMPNWIMRADGGAIHLDRAARHNVASQVRDCRHKERSL